MEALTERIAELPKEISAQPFYKQMQKIEERKNQCETRLESLTRSGKLTKANPMELRHYQALLVALKGLWHGGDPETKSKIIHWLIHKIEVGRDSVHIYYQLGETGLLGDLGAPGGKSFFKSECSNTLTNGARGGSRTPTPLGTRS